MATLIKRNGGWTARIRKTGYLGTAQIFASEVSALTWSRGVECDFEKFLTECLPEDSLLRTVGDLFKRYGREVTPSKKGRNPDLYRH